MDNNGVKVKVKYIINVIPIQMENTNKRKLKFNYVAREGLELIIYSQNQVEALSSF